MAPNPLFFYIYHIEHEEEEGKISEEGTRRRKEVDN